MVPRNLYITIRLVGTRNTLIFSARIGLITTTPPALYTIPSPVISNIKSLSFINISLRPDYNIQERRYTTKVSYTSLKLYKPENISLI
jgi:hypothetical protein